MAHAERAVSKPAAHANYFNICIVISAIVSYLLYAAQSGKIAYGICEHRFAAKRHAGGKARHILLGYAGIYKLIGEFFPKRLQHTEAQIACDKHNIFILFSYIHKGFNKRVSQSNYLL